MRNPPPPPWRYATLLPARKDWGLVGAQCFMRATMIEIELIAALDTLDRALSNGCTIRLATDDALARWETGALKWYPITDFQREVARTSLLRRVDDRLIGTQGIADLAWATTAYTYGRRTREV